jgi:carbon-monoxide dehydrogenase medium subunit
MRARKAEDLLAGNRLNDDLLNEVGQAAADESQPISDIHASEDFRRYLVNVFTKRMVRAAWEKAAMTTR